MEHVAGLAARGVEEIRLPTRRAQRGLDLALAEDHEGGVPVEQAAGVVGRSLEDAIEDHHRSDGNAEVAEAPGLGMPGFDLGVPPAKDVAQPVDLAERPPQEDDGHDRDDGHDEQRIPRERQHLVEEGVARQLDDRDEGDRQQDGGEPETAHGRGGCMAGSRAGSSGSGWDGPSVQGQDRRSEAIGR